MKSTGTDSKFKFLFGEASKKQFEGIILSDAATESNFIRSNGKYTAIPWNSKGGGVIAVQKAYDYKRLEADVPLIKGHAGPVVDFDFSPFNDNLLATASEDGTVKLWVIPEDGITKDVTEWDAELNSQSKKLIFSKFHPSADYTIATSGLDQTVRVWDIQQQKCATTFSDLKHTTYGLEWSHNGSLLAALTKDKTLSFFDPRNDTACQKVSTHEGARQQKFVWLGDSQTIMTCGFSKLATREYAIWDARNFAAPLVKRQLDDYSGIPFAYYDEDQKVVYVAGKGESAISFFQYNTTNPNLIEYLGSYKGKEPQKGFSFLPKRCVDQSVNEVNRGVRLTAKTVEYVHLKVPTKSAGFQSHLYPPVRSQEPAMKFDDYIAGQDREPLRFELRPETQVSSGPSKVATFAARAEPISHINTAPVRSQADQEEINALNRKIQELTEDLQSAKQEAAQLREEVESLAQSNENMVATKQNLEELLQQANELNEALKSSATSQAYNGYSQEQEQYQQQPDGGDYNNQYTEQVHQYNDDGTRHEHHHEQQHAYQADQQQEHHQYQ